MSIIDSPIQWDYSCRHEEGASSREETAPPLNPFLELPLIMTSLASPLTRTAIASPTQSWMILSSAAAIDHQTTRMEVNDLDSDLPFGEYIVNLSRRSPRDPWDEDLFVEAHQINLRSNCDRFAFIRALVAAQFEGWKYEGFTPAPLEIFNEF